MSVRGTRVDFRSYDVAAARSFGIETVHQERTLGERQALWRNVFVGRHLTGRLGFIKVRAERAIAVDLLRGRVAAVLDRGDSDEEELMRRVIGAAEEQGRP